MMSEGYHLHLQIDFYLSILLILVGKTDEKRPERHKQMKQLINALKVRPRSKKELMDVLKEDSTTSFQKSPEALRKRCERHLKKLEEDGLIEARGDKYCWYIYVNEFDGQEDYHAKLNHSIRLIPAFRRIAGINVPHYSNGPNESKEDAIMLDECARDHLRSYQGIWALFESLRSMREKAEQAKGEFNTCLMDKLESEFKEKLAKSNRDIRLKSHVTSNIPSLIHSLILNNIPLSIETDKDGSIWLEGSLIARGNHLFKRVKEFLERETVDESNITAVYQIQKIEEQALAAQLSLQREVRKLIIRIESGEPLLGGCETCPKVYIRAKRAQA